MQVTILLEEAIQMCYKSQEVAKGLGDTLEIYMSNCINWIIVCIEVHRCPRHMNQKLHFYDSFLMTVQS